MKTIKYLAFLITVGVVAGVSFAQASIFDFFTPAVQDPIQIFGAPQQIYQSSLFPANTTTTSIGSSTRPWPYGYFTNASTTVTSAGTFCLTGDTCRTTWGAGLGTVTSVDMSVPTGLTIGGNPITTSGTLALSLTSGYKLLTNNASTTWDLKLSSPLNVTSGTIANASSTYLTVSGTIFSPTIDGLVPYTGATGNVDLGVNTLLFNGGDLIKAKDAIVNDTAGGIFNAKAGNGLGTGGGGTVVVYGGNGGETGNGGYLEFDGGNGGATSGNGGDVNFYGGQASAGDSNGGNVNFYTGQLSGTG